MVPYDAADRQALRNGPMFEADSGELVISQEKGRGVAAPTLLHSHFA